jgi:hypothetical protein
VSQIPERVVVPPPRDLSGHRLSVNGLHNADHACNATIAGFDSAIALASRVRTKSDR